VSCGFSSLEDLLTSVDGFGLHNATPLQRAICRIVEGVPLDDLLSHPHITQCVGDYRDCNGQRPKRVDIVSGVRTGKSLIAGVVATYASLTCDVSQLGSGEVPRVSVISIDKDKAQTVVDHMLGNIRRSERLRDRIIGKPLKASFSLMHPEEREIELMVVAGAGAGGSVVARWSAGVIADEFPRMSGEEDGNVVNFDEIVRSAEGRLLPGATILAIGSPWAPRGPAYRAVKERWLRPTPEHVVIRAPAYLMHPTWWSPERIAKMTPEARLTDVEAEFADKEAGLYSITSIQECTT
jgi:hypothetical protein